MSRIMPAMSDGRAFTNYVSSGLYNNYLEQKFGMKDDTEYRRFIQKNSKEVEKTTNALTAFYVKPPAFPATNLNVVGDPDAAMFAAPAKQSQKILDTQYVNTMLNKKGKADAKYAKSMSMSRR